MATLPSAAAVVMLKPLFRLRNKLTDGMYSRSSVCRAVVRWSGALRPAAGWFRSDEIMHVITLLVYAFSIPFDVVLSL